MLSKSQARNFFLSMTAGFSGVFLFLTVDTIRQVPARSHAEALTPEVVRGKDLWDHNNCMGCHTLLGEGAYYAPELTRVVDRRGAAWIDRFLQDPEAMYPGRRRMVKYPFTEAERADLIAFFTWVGQIDTNGFPAKPDMAPRAVTAAAPGAAD
ncbi:MAG TPA: cytochrome c, partial [Myxococcota bacterium]|nr:cytochrome c [Myxococcota bacterium]